ncbi:MAG: hypothetical protein ACOZQL_25355 [Myxococcota bacterium]
MLDATLDALHQLLQRHVTGLENTWVHPSIPPRKLSNLRKAHRAHLPTGELVLALYDATLFGSATNGFAVTPTRLLWKNPGDDALCREWRTIAPDDFRGLDEDGDVLLGQASIATYFTGEDDAAGLAWLAALRDVARAAKGSP